MANYWDFHNNKEFQHKVKHEMQSAAIAILNELDTTAHHAERVVYANKILDGSASIVEFCIGVITNETIKTKITNNEDYVSDLEFVVSSIYNAFAGVAN